MNDTDTAYLKESGSLDIDRVLDVLDDILTGHNKPMGLHEPYFSGKEWDYVRECLDTRWVSSVGRFIDRFEADLADYLGVKRVVAVVNGTAGLHMALKLTGVGRGDEVIIPAVTFVATANAVAHCDAIAHFADSEMKTLGIDAVKLSDYLAGAAVLRDGGCFNRSTSRPIKAVVAMHTFGHPVDVDSLMEVCDRFNLALVEDAAESIGSLYKGRQTGTFGRASVFSFNGNKTITTGGGGAIATNDEKLADLAKHVTTTAKVPHPWEYRHDMIAYNYRMPNLNAALGCAQLEQLDHFLLLKRMLADRYSEEFRDVRGVHFFGEPDFAKSNYWLNTLVLDEERAGMRDALIERAQERGYSMRPLWIPLHQLSMYEACPRMDLSVAEDLARRIVNIPSSVYLGKSHNET
ncbi:MAG: LegC family aminotransferase [Syntrophorhabdaceae bacterium]|nr:LegC family aminotransferase [Syntrophorhabdaceae bacterium]